MNPIPFTYTHFLQAIQSMKDSMLMCYIDESVGIYCRIRGKSVGPRPASAKDYSPEYADAFETANYAIFKVARKLGSYNPEKAFRPYLREALQNTIKDILKEDGKGDFFNKTAHKKNQAEEPELHQRVDADTFGPDGAGREPDNEASERAERVRKHKDDALEAMIKFVDTLPEMKRAALYASAFGKALRPDLESYGRNYADILAGLYNTTAQYIRKLATEGKKAALAEVHRQGFSEKSMTEISMGFLQIRTPVQDINDKVLQAMSDLDSYQQFMFLRHLAGTNDDSVNIFKRNSSLMSIWSELEDRSAGVVTRKEDNNWEGLHFVTENTDPDDLTGPGKVYIKNAALASFTFGEYTTLDDMLFKLGVKLVISAEKPKRTVPVSISEWVLYWENEVERLKSLLGPDCEYNPLYLDAQKELEKAKAEKEAWTKMAYLGCYDRVSKEIWLYPNNMEEKERNEYLVTTFVHEAMHAYFDRHPHELFPYVATVEEPLAEFGMLLFLKETNNNYYNWAYDIVSRKETCYRYGAALMDCYKKGDTQIRTDLERYKRRVF